MKPNTILSTLICRLYKVEITLTQPIRLLKILKSNIKPIKTHRCDIKQLQNQKTTKKHNRILKFMISWEKNNEFPIIFQIKHDIKKKTVDGNISYDPPLLCDH